MPNHSDSRQEQGLSHVKDSLGGTLGISPQAGIAFDKAVRSGALNLPEQDDSDVTDKTRQDQTPQQPAPIWYGDPDKNPNAYVAVTFEDTQVVIRDGMAPDGKATKVSFPQWRVLTGQVDEDEQLGNAPDGDPQGDELAGRTRQRVEQDHDAQREAGNNSQSGPPRQAQHRQR